MIEDEELSNKLVKSLSNYYKERMRDFGGFTYKLILFAYPDERHLDITLRPNNYPQGWLYEIEQDFKYHAKRYLDDVVPGWSVNIEVY